MGDRTLRVRTRRRWLLGCAMEGSEYEEVTSKSNAWEKITAWTGEDRNTKKLARRGGVGKPPILIELKGLWGELRNSHQEKKKEQGRWKKKKGKTEHSEGFRRWALLDTKLFGGDRKRGKNHSTKNGGGGGRQMNWSSHLIGPEATREPTKETRKRESDLIDLKG